MTPVVADPSTAAPDRTAAERPERAARRMRRRTKGVGAAAAAALLAACVLGAAAEGAAAAGPPRQAKRAVPTAPNAVQLERDRREFLRLAKRGVRQARKHWWNAELGWYNDRLDRKWRANMPLARLWTIFPLFQTLNAIAIAEPTRRNRAAVRAFAANARRYWNPRLKPAGGWAWYPGERRANVRTYFDDAGWFGIAYLDAYEVTRERAFLRDAASVFRVILESAWDDYHGGTWWDSRHHHKTAEPLAAAALVGVRLYRLTGKPLYLAGVRKLLAFANQWMWNAERRLYQTSHWVETVLNYVQGMMIGVQLELCRLHSRPRCARAQRLARASRVAFPDRYEWSAPTDAIYLRFMLDLYRHDGDVRWYGAAYRKAKRAVANARIGGGLFLKAWNGKMVPGGLLRMHAASISLLAWVAATPPPPLTAR